MILLNDFERQWRDTRADTMAAMESVGASGWYILGKEVAAFEAALASYWKCEAAVGVASGLEAIEIALRALGCSAGDRVLTTPVTAFATTLAIVKIGAVPVFADCDGYGLIDLERCETVLRRGSTQFFVPVHLYGHSLDAAALAHLRNRYELSIVEDCAQSIGASHAGVPTGKTGQMAATSFYPTKNLGALGDGGAIVTDDTRLAACARQLRDYGQSGKYRHDDIGYNSRLDELQAAILRQSHLPRLEAWTARRKAVAAAYVDGIRNPHVTVPGAPPGSDSCWHLFPVLVEPVRKPAFLEHMRAVGVSVAEHYPTAVVDQRALRGVPHEVPGGCETARRLCRSEVSLPIHPYLADEEVRAVIEAVNRWGGE